MITLIATVHRERGICNSNELYRIIEDIAPEIIFEELSSQAFAVIYERSGPDTLETYTIRRYLEKHPTAHLPVDLDLNELVDKGFKNDILEMFDVFDSNHEYKDLEIQHESLSERLGFPYLNSDRYRQLSERRHLLEGVMLRLMNHEKMSQTYRGWLDIHDRRENEMIKNIYSYGDINRFNRGLFLVGAEHKKSMIDRIATFEKNNRLELNWIFNYFNQ